MTNTTSPATAVSGTLDPGDPRHRLARAVVLAGNAIAAVRPDQLGEPTPCPEFDVRALLGHLTAVLHRVANLGRGGQVFDTPECVTGVADDAWPEAWRAAAHDLQAVWSDSSLLGRTFRLPWAELPGAGLLAMYTSEITVHTWDLAQATGQHPAWDDEVVADSLALMQRILPPAEARQASYDEAARNMPAGRAEFRPPFAPAVPVPDGAPLIAQLAAWTGRTP